MSEGRRALSLRGVTMGESDGPWRPLTLDTTAGPIEARFYPEAGSALAILLLGDDDLAPALNAGATVLTLVHRHPDDPVDCVMDALVGLHVLNELGVARVALVAVGEAAGIAAEVARVGAGVGAIATINAPAPEAAVPTRAWATPDPEATLAWLLRV